MKTRIVSVIRASRYNRLDLADLGAALALPPAALLPLVDELRKSWILAGSVREGRRGITQQQRAYTTGDGIGVVSIRQQ
jgi:hypothetical protein